MSLTKKEIKANLKLYDEWLDEEFEVEYWCGLNEMWDSILRPFNNLTNVLYRRKPQPKTRLLTQEDIINSSSPVWVKIESSKENYILEIITRCTLSMVFTRNLSEKYEWLKDKDIFINGKLQKGVMEI